MDWPAERTLKVRCAVPAFRAISAIDPERNPAIVSTTTKPRFSTIPMANACPNEAGAWLCE